MNDTLKRINASRVLAEVTVDAGEVDQAFDRAAKVVAGLKERPLGVKQLGENPEETERRAIATRATREVVELGIHHVVESRGLRLSSNPKLDIDVLAQSGEPYCFSVELDVVPEFEISGYDNFEVSVDASLAVTQKDIDERLEAVRGRAARVEKDSKKPISENDIVELSFVSYLDGETYEGNAAHGYSYTMGSFDLPEEFERGLMGLTTGAEKTIEFTVPANYPNEEIAGKQARFDVKIGRVASCTLPNLNDDFAREFGYADLAAWRKKLEGELAREKEGDYQLRCEKAVREELGRRLVGNIDDGMVDAHAERMFSAFKTDLGQQGIPFEEYCRFLNLSEDSVKEEMRKESEALLRENLALESLFRALNMRIADEDIRATAAEMALSGGMEAPGALSDFSADQRSALREMTMHRMATEWLLDHATFVDAS